MTVDLCIVSRLCDVNTIEHVKETLSFHWHCELVIQHVEKDVCSTLVWCCNSEVIDLMHKDNTSAVDCARVEVWFMYHRREAKFTKDSIRVLLPQTRGFRVALHS